MNTITDRETYESGSLSTLISYENDIFNILGKQLESKLDLKNPDANIWKTIDLREIYWKFGISQDFSIRRENDEEKQKVDIIVRIIRKILLSQWLGLKFGYANLSDNDNVTIVLSELRQVEEKIKNGDLPKKWIAAIMEKVKNISKK